MRPIVVSMLTAQNGKAFACLALPDSGADHCVFPVSFAGILGLDLLKMKYQMTGGVGNSGNVTFYDTIRITINQDIDFEAYAGFTLGLESMGLGLLGQTGFFSRYNVSFDHAAGQFFIETRSAPTYRKGFAGPPQD